MLILMLFIEIIFLIIISYIRYKKILLPNNIFTLLWGIGLIISLFYTNERDIIVPSSKLIIMVMVVLFVFNIFYIFLTSRSFFSFDMKKDIYINEQIIKILFWCALILYSPNLIDSISLILNSGLNFDLIRRMYVAASYEGNGIFVYITRIIPNGIMNSLLIVSAYYIVKKNFKMAKYGIILMIINVLCFGGRSSILAFLEYYLITFYLLHNHEKKKIHFQKKYIIMILLIIVAITISRDLGSMSMLDMIATYFILPFSFMQYILNNPFQYDIGQIHYGYLSLGFIFSPFALILSMFFRDINLPSYYFDINAQNFVNLSELKNVGWLINNSTTSLYYFILDFGINYYYIGAVIYAILICIAQYWFKKESNKEFSFFILVCFYQSIFNSTTNYVLTNISTSFTLFFLFILTRKIKFRLLN